MIKELLLYFALLLWFVVPSEAQPTIFAPQIEADKDETILVDIMASDLEPIIGMQFAIDWDEAVLHYFNHDNFSLPITGIHFNISETGKLRFQWYGDPLTIEDDQVLFSLRFKVIGEPASSSLIDFTIDSTENSTPFVLEMINSSSQLVDANYNDGMVSVIDPLSNNSPIPSADVAIFQTNQPNPFHTYTIIPFEIKESQDIQLTIYDTLGREIYQQAKHFTTGKNTWRIDSRDLAQSGMYVYRLQSAYFDLTQKMIYNR